MSDFLQDILNSTFFEALFKIIMGVLTGIVSVILWPFSFLINQLFPSFDNALSQISNLFDYIGQYIGWATSALGVPAIVIAMLVGYWSFVVAVTLGTWAIKLILKWKQAIF